MAIPTSRDGWHVYVISEAGAEDNGPCKVGTARDVGYRLSGLKNGNWRDLIVVKSIWVPSRSDALAIEARAHKAFEAVRIGRRDWFRCPASRLVSFIEKFEVVK